MKNINWENVKEASGYPVPGGYAAKITRVEDREDKEYLWIEWDFADGEFKGLNKKMYDQYDNWRYPIIRSYKEKALPFFKGFKTSVERSNNGYVFNNDPQSLVGKYVGVILGEEEYKTNDGTIKTRLYVYGTCEGSKIRSGDFKIPELKRLDGASSNVTEIKSAADLQEFAEISDDDLPF